MPRAIDRSAFIYMDPVAGDPQFAQCVSCRFWMPQAHRCALFITEPHVAADATCGLYVYGRPSDDQSFRPTVWPREAGLVTRQVRCENCIYFRPESQGCHLFYRLNTEQPGMWDLDIRVHPLGCCNAQTPIE